MTITLYNYTKPKKSTARPSGGGRNVEVKLKRPTSKYEPTFVLGGSAFVGVEDYSLYRYVQWDGRYYFVKDCTFVLNDLYELVCELDYLATYRTNIVGADCYIERSSKLFNTAMIDLYCATYTKVDQKATTAQLITNGIQSPTFANGTFILEYVTETSPTGTGFVLINAGTLSNLMKKVYDPQFFNDLWFTFNNSNEAFISCQYLPLTIPQLSSTQTIYLGRLNTGLSGTQPTTLKYSALLTIPWFYPHNDFRRSSRYTSITLYLPAYGIIDLPSDLLLNHDNVIVDVQIDYYRGELSYIVRTEDNIAITKITTNIAMPIGIGTNSQNWGKFASGVVTTLASTFSGYLPGAIGGIVDTVSAQARTPNVQGNTGSLASILSNPTGDWRKVALTVYSKYSTDPNNYVNTVGRPKQTVDHMSSLVGGFVKTYNANIMTDNASHSDIVNGLLDEGIMLI